MRSQVILHAAMAYTKTYCNIFLKLKSNHRSATVNTKTSRNLSLRSYYFTGSPAREHQEYSYGFIKVLLNVRPKVSPRMSELEAASDTMGQ